MADYIYKGNEPYTPEPTRKPIRCGTVQGYSKHRRNKTPSCAPCRIAYNDDNRARAHRNKEREAV